MATPLSSAAMRFACIADLLYVLGETIQTYKPLFNLCLVCKDFNAIFSPFLYRKIRLHLNGDYNDLAGRKKMGRLVRSPCLSHAKTLAFHRDATMRTIVTYNEHFDHAIQLMPPNMPRLESIEFNYTLPSTATINALHESCQNLSSIVVQYPGNADDYMGRITTSEFIPEQNHYIGHDHGQPFEIQDFTLFPNLRRLCLHNLCGNFPDWRRKIVQILRSSPAIESLYLSLGHDALDRRHMFQAEQFVGWFDKLCDDYAREGGEPLHLKTLRLGQAAYPLDADSLPKLTKLAFLEEVSVANHSVWDEDMILDLYQDHDESGIPFELFSAEHAPNLRRFGVTDCRADVLRAFAGPQDGDRCSAGRPLAFSCDSQIGKGVMQMQNLLRPDPNRPGLPLPLRLRMVGLELEGEPYNSIDTGRELLAQVLRDLIESNASTLEGLDIRLYVDPEAPDQGFEQLDLLERALRELPRLTHLTLAWQRYALMPGGFPREALRAAAERAALAAPRLRYVGAYAQVHWRIWRKRDGSVALEELEPRERDAVELLGFRNYGFWVT